MPVATPILSSSPTLPTPKRPQSILRGSSTESSHKKRPSSSLDSASQDSAVAKRQKVQFVPRPEVHVVRDEESEKSTALVTAEIRHALTAHNEGEKTAEYEELQQCFTTPENDEDAPSTGYLAKCLVGLASNSNLLKKNSAGLVHATLRMKWLHRNDDFVNKYQKFLSQLVGSQSGYVSAVLKMLVENFAHLSTSSGGVRKTPGLTRQTQQDRVHSCIKYVVFMVPSATSMLCSVLSNTFPFITDTKRAHVEYVQNLLRLASSMPELRGHLLDLILDKLVQIDVQVQLDIQDLEEDMTDILLEQRRVNEDPSQAQDPDSTEASESSSSDDEFNDPEAARIKSLRLLVAKLDAMLDLLFIYINPLLTKSPHDTSQQTFNHLLAHFRNTLLRTSASRHTQFIIFTAAQTQPHYAQQYIDMLLSIITDPTRPAILRISSATYLGSFTARAKALPSSTTHYTFHALSRFLNAYRKQYESTCRAPDLRRHGSYYAAVQACLYIFCFRWRDFLTEEPESDETDEDLIEAGKRGELVWEPDVYDTFQLAFATRFNPLKVCAPLIVEEFAQVAFVLNYMYIFPALEANRRVRLLQDSGSSGMRETSLTGLTAQRFQQLEAYFPFDPYQLPASKRWVEEWYIDYKELEAPDSTVAGAQEYRDEAMEGDEEDEDEDDGVEEVDEDDESVGTPEDD
ncbi:MAG: hypothetical protein Q9162_005029 [Coniocarpon cinnabarinum]